MQAGAAAQHARGVTKMERLFHAWVSMDTAAVNPPFGSPRTTGMQRTTLVASVVAACSIAAAHAQEGDPEEGARGALVPYIEVAGFAGYRMGGDFDLDSSDASADLDDHG